MKTIITLLFLLLFLTSKSQVTSRDYSDLLSIVGGTSEHIIEIENFNNSKDIGKKLETVEYDAKSAFKMYYSLDIGNQTITTVYYFNKKNICTAYRKIFDLKSYKQELDEIKQSFTKVTNKLYVHPTLNLKVTLDNDPTQDIGSVTYQHKNSN